VTKFTIAVNQPKAYPRALSAGGKTMPKTPPRPPQIKKCRALARHDISRFISIKAPDDPAPNPSRPPSLSQLASDQVSQCRGLARHKVPEKFHDTCTRLAREDF
jgi:hypothetical protein